MSEIVALIQHMRAKGIAADLILEAVEALSMAKQDLLEQRRAADRVRKARSRDAARAALKRQELCHVTPADTADKNLSPLSSPPNTPTPPNTPPIIPPIHENIRRENAKKPEAKGSRLPVDWELPDDWLSDAGQIAFKAKTQASTQEIRNEADKFRDYWTAKPGAAGRKLDWRGTWRNWFRSYLDRRRNHASGSGVQNAPGQHRGGSLVDAAIRARLRRENRDGVSDHGGWGPDVPAEASILDGHYRLVS